MNINIVQLNGMEIFVYFFILYLFSFTNMNNVHTNSGLYNMNCSINGSCKNVLPALC